MPPDKQTRIETEYPDDPAVFRSVYSNHVNISYLPEEVYLDFCHIQIQSASVQEDGMVKEVPATPHTRVILSRSHAKRLASVIEQTLSQQSEEGE